MIIYLPMPSGTYTVENHTINLQTSGEEVDLIDITKDLQKFAEKISISDGSINVFIPGSTASVILTEFESGLIKDTKSIIQKLIRQGAGYCHDRIDNNAHSHLRSSLYGSSITIPIINGHLALGTWQQVVFADFDVRPRNRRVILQISGIV